MQFRGHQKNQNEPNALAGTTLVATIKEAMKPIPGLTHAQHQQLLLLLGNNEASTGNSSAIMTTSNFFR